MSAKRVNKGGLRKEGGVGVGLIEPSLGCGVSSPVFLFVREDPYKSKHCFCFLAIV